MAGKIQFIRDFVWPIGVTLSGAVIASVGAFSTAHEIYTAGLEPYAWIIIGIAIMFLGFVLALFRATERTENMIGGSRVEPTQKDNAAPRVAASPLALRRVFENEDIKLADLLLPGEFILDGRTFVNCVLRGPAMLVLINKVHFSRVILESGSPESHFVETSLPVVSGTLGLHDCRFDNCRLKGVGFIGSPESIVRAKRAFIGDAA